MKNNEAKNDNTTITIRISNKDAKAIDDIAKACGSTRSSVVRNAIRNNLEKYMSTVRYVEPDHDNKIQAWAYVMMHAVVDSLDMLKRINIKMDHYYRRTGKDQDISHCVNKEETEEILHRLADLLYQAGKLSLNIQGLNLGKERE